LAIDAFSRAGLTFYDRRPIAQPIGTAALRAGVVSRYGKSVRIHQYLLVFVQGDPKAAAAAARRKR
jgi:hypothetical protein